MKKSNEELIKLQEELKQLREKLSALTEEELEMVVGGTGDESLDTISIIDEE